MCHAAILAELPELGVVLFAILELHPIVRSIIYIQYSPLTKPAIVHSQLIERIWNCFALFLGNACLPNKKDVLRGWNLRQIVLVVFYCVNRSRNTVILNADNAVSGIIFLSDKLNQIIGIDHILIVADDNQREFVFLHTVPKHFSTTPLLDFDKEIDRCACLLNYVVNFLWIHRVVMLHILILILAKIIDGFYHEVPKLRVIAAEFRP